MIANFMRTLEIGEIYETEKSRPDVLLKILRPAKYLLMRLRIRRLGVRIPPSALVPLRGEFC
jgi:hypothetical protein